MTPCHPETAFTEFESAKYLCNVLRKEGFTVEENIAGIATAFTGTFGSGKPVIGILSERSESKNLRIIGTARQIFGAKILRLRADALRSG